MTDGPSKDVARQPNHAPKPSGIGAPDHEYRDPRFAELDARIKAQEAVRQQKATAKTKQRRRPGPRLPAVVRKEITQCAQQLRQHRNLFMADPKLKDRASRFLRSLLPPKRKRGRPGDPVVTKAIVLIARLQRQHPEHERRQLWQQVYKAVTPNYANLPREQQRSQEIMLRERVRSRRNQLRKRQVAAR